MTETNEDIEDLLSMLERHRWDRYHDALKTYVHQYDAFAKRVAELNKEVERLKALVPPFAERGPWPCAGTWSTFAMEVVADRDEARARVRELEEQLAKGHALGNMEKRMIKEGGAR